MAAKVGLGQVADLSVAPLHPPCLRENIFDLISLKGST